MSLNRGNFQLQRFILIRNSFLPILTLTFKMSALFEPPLALTNLFKEASILFYDILFQISRSKMFRNIGWPSVFFSANFSLVTKTHTRPGRKFGIHWPFSVHVDISIALACHQSFEKLFFLLLKENPGNL